MRIRDISGLPESLRKDLPNICQADKTIPILSENPKTHCGPVAIANTMIFLAKNGHQMIVEPQGDLSEAEAISRLIEQLAKNMQTGSIGDLAPGTTPLNLQLGLQKYVRDRGYEVSDYWMGWGAGELPEITNPASPEEIINATNADQNAILHVGWYFNTGNGLYERKSGHFVNNVGWNNLNTDDDIKLVIHDPSPRSNGKAKVCTAKETGFITLKQKQTNDAIRSITSSDYHELAGINVNQEIGANCGVIDTVYSFAVSTK